jgi:glutaredoxin
MVHGLEEGGAGAAPEASTPATQLEAGAPAPADSPAARLRSALGSVLLFAGIGLLGLLLIDPGELPLSMPRSWYFDRTFWVAGGLVAVAAGWHLLRDPDGGPRPGRGGTGAPEGSLSAEGLGIAGGRFARLLLYTRSGCHLCDEARATLNKYAAYLPQIVEVDIDGDPDLMARFSTCVPVVELDGKVRFRGRVNELLLRRLIAATPSRDTARSGEDL